MTSYGKFRGLLVLFFFLSSIFLVTAGPPTALAQDVVVTAAVPDNAPQGSVNLLVQVKGNGFKKGAIAKWLVTGSETDTGGVTVNSTTFVSSSELLANITVAPNAQTGKKLDIKVTLSTGRTGKGIELFCVTVPPHPEDCFSSGPGCLDTTFGDGTGKVTTKTAAGTPYETKAESAQAVALQSDGRIVVAGNTPSPDDGTLDFAVVRYNTDGTIDFSFGTGGIVKTSLSTGRDYCYAVALQSVSETERILVAGSSLGAMAVVRYNPDGSLDPSFGSGGVVMVSFPPSTSASANAVAVQSDGKIVLAGGDGTKFALARLTREGALDPSFGANGKVMVGFSTRGSSTSHSNGLAIQADGKIVVGGYADNAVKSSFDFAVARLLDNGALDSTFGSGGKVLTDFGNTSDLMQDLAIDAVGNIVAAGWKTIPNSAQARNYALARFLPNGQLDPTFGIGGKTTTDCAGAMDVAIDVVIQPDGQIVAGGVTVVSAWGECFSLARYNSDGTLDAAFGSDAGRNGTVITSFASNSDEIYALALQPDGKILAIGTSVFGDVWKWSLARYNQ